MKNKLEQLLTSEFIALAQIPSASGFENTIATYLQKKLHILGLSYENDHSENLNNSNAGNITAGFPDSLCRNLFVAHMDTVQKNNENIQVIFKDGTFKSDGSTILGADNKASIAVLLTLLQLYPKKWKKGGNFVAFTTREEQGEMGSRYLKIPTNSLECIYNIDGSGPIGTIDTASLGVTGFEIMIQGKSSHAAMAPEKGINALKAGVEFVSSILLGKFKDGSTCNIGTFVCQSPTNVVPDKVRIIGEVRSYDDILTAKKIEAIQKKLYNICKKYETTQNFTILYSIPSFSSQNNELILKKILEAIKKTGVKPVIQKASYTSDASYLCKHGIPTVTICKGGENAHSHAETITLKEMISLYKILYNLL